VTSLLSTISARAEASFGQPVAKTNFNQWYQHWINTGRQWQSELESEGLFLTAYSVAHYVAEAEKDLKRMRDVRFTHYKQFPLFAQANFVFYSVGFDAGICHWMVPGTWRE
jgi:hypothetical protein